MKVPFIKWAGGKRWLASRLAPYFEEFGGTYIEPFLGSGAIFFRFQPEKSILSDKNRELIDTYKAIACDPDRVVAALKIHAGRHCDEYFYKIRAQRPRKSHTIAARFLYLNRTCWNGLYRVNRQGKFNVPRGTKDEILFENENFQEISNILAKADIRLSDFEDVIDLAKSGDLIFADPPYTVSHNNNGFIKYNEAIFSWEDQRRLASALTRADQRGCRIICTNAAHDDLRDLYSGNFDIQAIGRKTVISGQAKGRRRTEELFVTSTSI